MNISMSSTTAMRPPPPPGPPPGPPPTGEDLIASLDTDESGSLSASELEDTDLGKLLSESFDDIDTDADGLLTAEELDTYGQSMAENRPPPPSTPSIESMIAGLLESLSQADESEETTTSSATDTASIGGIDTSTFASVQAVYQQMVELSEALDAKISELA